MAASALRNTTSPALCFATTAGVCHAVGAAVDTFELAAVRRNVSLDELPDHLPAAVLAAEGDEADDTATDGDDAPQAR